MENNARFTVAIMILSCVAGCQAQEQKVTFNSGKEGIPSGPVAVKLAEKTDPGAYVLRNDGQHGDVPAQVDRQGRVWWWSEALPADTSREWTLHPARNVKPRVDIRKAGDERIDIVIDGDLFTAVQAKKDEPKVYLYPVFGPTGEPVTRHYPMKDVPGERQDHHHHRSIWTAHGDIRVGDFDKHKSNYWHEPTAGGGSPPTLKPMDEVDNQVLRKVTYMTGGPVFGEIEMVIDWIAAGGRKDLEEVRTYRFFAADGDSRMIDQENTFRFTEGDTMFANTKEGGICALRIATSMDESKHEGKGGDGHMTNSAGQVGEKECWGKPAKWCDYVGPVAGETVGIAVFDAPTNFRHPVRWHIRGYGLYTANPFGAGNFTDGKEDGTAIFKKGENLTFNYRIYIHEGDTKAANVDAQYDLFSRLHVN